MNPPLKPLGRVPNADPRKLPITRFDGTVTLPYQPPIGSFGGGDDPRFPIAYVLKQARPLFAALAKTHNKDEAAATVAKRIVEHLELCGYRIIRAKPPTPAPDTHPASRGGKS